MNLRFTKIIYFVFGFFFFTDTFGQTDSSNVRVEINPIFRGGIPAFYNYVNKGLKIPKSVAKANYQGKILVKFIIEKDGKAIVDSINYDKMTFLRKNIKDELKEKAKDELNTEVKRLFAEMPIWTPGFQDNRPVRVFFMMPFSIYLE